MTSLIVHFVLGIVFIAWVARANPQIFSRPASGPLLSPLEIIYYVVGVVSVIIGYYFNHQFVIEYQVAGGNLFSGPASYQNFVALGYANPAAASASQDYTIVNVILLPLFTIVDGRRRNIGRPWLFFVISLFTSCAFAYAFYFAVVERQRRHEKAATALDSIPA
jgi:predicted permease